MAKYKLCPRCELNYIPEDQDYCEFCKDELRGILSSDNDFEDEYTKLCPRCHVNYISDDQEYCDACRADMDKINVMHENEATSWGDVSRITPLEEAETMESDGVELEDEENEDMVLSDDDFLDDETDDELDSEMAEIAEDVGSDNDFMNDEPEEEIEESKPIDDDDDFSFDDDMDYGDEDEDDEDEDDDDEDDK